MAKIGVILCNCFGEIGNTIDLESVKTGGRFLLVQAHRPDVGYYRVNALTGEHTTVRLGLPNESFKQPTLSPDGKTLYFVHAEPDAKQEAIRARDLETGQERVVCQPALPWPMGPAVSPDGRHLAFHEDDGESYSLTVALVATGQPRRVFRSPQRIQTLAWTPDGRHLLFGMERPAGGAPEPAMTDLWLVATDGNGRRAREIPNASEGFRRILIDIARTRPGRDVHGPDPASAPER